MGPMFGIPLAMEPSHRCRTESAPQERGGVEGVFTRQGNLNPMSLFPAGHDLPEAPNGLLFLRLQGYRLLFLCLQGFLGLKLDIQAYITTSLISRSG